MAQLRSASRLHVPQRYLSTTSSVAFRYSISPLPLHYLSSSISPLPLQSSLLQPTRNISKASLIREVTADVLSFQWAPSKSMKIAMDILLHVASVIFSRVFPEVKDFRQFLKTGVDKPIPQSANKIVFDSSDDSINLIVKLLETSEEVMLDIGNKEASGYPSLAYYLKILVQDINQRRCTNLKVEMMSTVIETMNPGANPSTDFTIVLLSDSGISRRPLVLLKYKPLIADELDDINPRYLMEVILQGYYCMEFYEEKSCILCLTDINRFHYFGVRSSPGGIDILWIHSEKKSNDRFTSVLKNCNFLSSLPLGED